MEFDGFNFEEDKKAGDTLNVDIFKEGEYVDIVGTSKGKGFSGVFRRFGFGGNPASRGAHESYRGGGSVGCHTYPGRVLKGKKMAGRMGGDKVTVENLKVLKIDSENNLLFIKGAVPGPSKSILFIEK